MKFKTGLILLYPLLFGYCIRVPKTTTYDSRLEKITIDGYSFHVKTFGNKSLLLLVIVHGGPGGDFNYLLSLSSLSDQYNILFYDQRNTGLSPRDNQVTGDVESNLKDLEALVLFFRTGACIIRVIV